MVMNVVIKIFKLDKIIIMKKLFYFCFLGLFLFACNKENLINNESDAKIDIRSIFGGNDNEYVYFALSSNYGDSYYGNSKIASFSNEARFADNSIEGNVFFNDSPIALDDSGQYFLNSTNANEHSTPGYELVCKDAIGKTGRFKLENFNNIRDCFIDIYIPDYIIPKVNSNSDGVSIEWNVDNNINNNIFGVFLTYSDSNDPSKDFIKHYIFDQSLGSAFINNEDLHSIPYGARVSLTFARGIMLTKTIDSKLVKALAYTMANGTFYKK